jgi:hypothetical protein
MHPAKRLTGRSACIHRWHLYVHGVEVGTVTAFSGKIKYDSPVGDGAIGAYRGACKLTGTVDEVRIWSDALPVAQIWSLISSGLGREPVAPNAEQWFARGL